ncbi:TRAM domain-containing protein [Candidatus Woesearchaeota archaeon]|nr:TRAM domain-containing protein [Candidatus Woesearchaeota archaeon]
MYGDRDSGYGDRGSRGGDRGGFRRGGSGGGFGGSQRPSFAPVKVGDEIDVRIEAVGEKGDGVAKKDGFVLFVPNTNTGDQVKIRVTKVLRKVGFAEVVGQSGGEASAQPAAEQPAEEAGYSDEQQQQEAPSEEEAPADSEDFGEEEQN